MNNRLIYILITLMLVSLVGIIWIQTNWIQNAIEDQEKDFSVRVNEALNTVNDSIDTEEIELFLKREFGGIDSLMNEFTFMPRSGDSTILEINVEHGKEGGNTLREETMIIHSSSKSHSDHIEFREDSMRSSQRGLKESGKLKDSDAVVWMEHFEEKRVFDSLKEDSNVVMQHRNRVASVVQRFTIESLLTGKLEDRISAKDLEDKIQKALLREGIEGAFDYAVKNENTGVLEVNYQSKNFDTTRSENTYSKRLFQSDRRSRMNYTLLLQPEDSANFVWAQVWKMTLLSSVFTILILLTFGYALYFIFKQKKVSHVKNDFINNMTHELKTPLASISLATASIRHPEILKNPEEVRRLVKLIEDEKDRINYHVERVLDTAALESGEMKLEIAPQNVLELLKQAAKNVELSLLHAGGSITLPEMENVIVKGDSFHLTNVFTNIFDNGIKYRSESSPEIQVSLEVLEKSVVIRISDNGIGMTSKQQKHAFDKFYRAESGDVHNRKGFGLGLSYVKSIVERLGGKVSLQSKSNEGTTVAVILERHE